MGIHICELFVYSLANTRYAHYVSGELRGSTESFSTARQNSSLNLVPLGREDVDLPEPSLLDDIGILPDMGIEFDFDPWDLLISLDDGGDGDSVSVDSAVGSSPSHVSVRNM